MTDIETIQAELRKFNRERDWDQFHNWSRSGIMR